MRDGSRAAHLVPGAPPGGSRTRQGFICTRSPLCSHPWARQNRGTHRKTEQNQSFRPKRGVTDTPGGCWSPACAWVPAQLGLVAPQNLGIPWGSMAGGAGTMPASTH